MIFYPMPLLRRWRGLPGKKYLALVLSTRFAFSAMDLFIFMISKVVTLEYEISCPFGSIRALPRTPVQIELEETRCDFGLHLF